MVSYRRSASLWTSAPSWRTHTCAQNGGVMADTRPAEKSEVIRRLIRLFEAVNVDEALTMFTEDARHRFGNSLPTVGREEMRAAAAANHLAAIKGYRFN